MATATATREQQLEQRLAELENLTAQLIRATFTIARRFSGHGAGWESWQQLGADHQALAEMHAYLQRHPAPEQG